MHWWILDIEDVWLNYILVDCLPKKKCKSKANEKSQSNSFFILANQTRLFGFLSNQKAINQSKSQSKSKLPNTPTIISNNDLIKNIFRFPKRKTFFYDR